MTPHNDAPTKPINEQQWPKQDSPGDTRGLPGYPRDEADKADSEGRNTDPELGFDPESPDLQDPQVDPKGAPRIADPADKELPKRAPGEEYPPYPRK